MGTLQYVGSGPLALIRAARPCCSQHTPWALGLPYMSTMVASRRIHVNMERRIDF
jgi:hypothetical protein